MISFFRKYLMQTAQSKTREYLEHYRNEVSIWQCLVPPGSNRFLCALMGRGEGTLLNTCDHTASHVVVPEVTSPCRQMIGDIHSQLIRDSSPTSNCEYRGGVRGPGAQKACREINANSDRKRSRILMDPMPVRGSYRPFLLRYRGILKNPD